MIQATPPLVNGQSTCNTIFLPWNAPYPQDTVDAWLDGMTTAISNAQKRKAQGEQAQQVKTEQKQETSTAQETKAEQRQEARKGTVQELELALEATREDVKNWEKYIDFEERNNIFDRTSRELLAEGVQNVRLVEKMLAKAQKGDALSSEELATLDSIYDYQVGYGKSSVKDWKAFREQAQEQKRYSINDKSHYDYSKSFAEQIEDYKKGAIPKGDTLVVGATPDVFRKIGMAALPMTINTTHVDYALNGTKDFDHHLGEALLKQLPDAIQHPVAIMTSGTRPNSSIVAMLEVRHNGKQVVVPVTVDGFGNQNGVIIDSNAITSIYGKNYSISKVLHDAIEQEANGQFRLFYLNENKTTKLLQEARVPMPKIPATHNGGFIRSLTDIDSPVKSNITSQTDTQQFKRWFGKSVVKNADGSPMKLYHGTNADFTVFERGDIGYHVGTKEQAEDRINGVKGGHVMELYASIQNPLHAAFDFGDWHGQNVAEMLVETEQFEDFANRDEIEARLSEIAQMKNRQEADIALREYLQSLGYDGIAYENRWEGEGESYIAFESGQLKSATDNIGLFDRENPDIRFSLNDSFRTDQAIRKVLGKAV